MKYARTLHGEKEIPTPGVVGRCPVCDAEVRAKCGEVIPPYWSHISSKDCDPWSEGETDWHMQSKNQFIRKYQEVTMGPHRADVCLPGGFVIEFQHSPITVYEVHEREDFYKNMIWVVDARGFQMRGLPEREPIYTDFNETVFTFGRENNHGAYWPRPRHCWIQARKTVILYTTSGMYVLNDKLVMRAKSHLYFHFSYINIQRLLMVYAIMKDPEIRSVLQPHTYQ